MSKPGANNTVGLDPIVELFKRLVVRNESDFHLTARLLDFLASENRLANMAERTGHLACGGVIMKGCR